MFFISEFKGFKILTGFQNLLGILEKLSLNIILCRLINILKYISQSQKFSSQDAKNSI